MGGAFSSSSSSSDSGGVFAPITTAETGVRDIILGTEQDLTTVIDNTETNIANVLIHTQDNIVNILETTQKNIVNTIQFGTLVVGGVLIATIWGATKILGGNGAVAKKTAEMMPTKEELMMMAK